MDEVFTLGKGSIAMEARYFKTGVEFRTWLERHHETSNELLVGYFKRSSRKPSITWPESVDEALCFGWIDGVRKGIDDERYTIRFTPRKVGSIWSAANIKRARELIDLGLMTPAGLRAFHARRDDRSAVYSYEQGETALDEAYERRLRRNAKAWEFFQSSPASYRKAAVHWVMSAKREETRQRRLATLVDESARKRTVRPLTPRRRQG
jgi:uncharacterized protein YdeI (YjbR/CyaY-like superfamily)